MRLSTLRTVFLTALVVQSLHMVEHVAQVVQKFILGSPHAHGFLGALDLEWVHLLYNVALFAPMYAILLWGWQHLKRLEIDRVFVGLGLFQGYHLIEHVTKVVQHIERGVQGTPGILGHLIPVIWLHFWINFIIVAILFWAFLRARWDRAVEVDVGRIVLA